MLIILEIVSVNHSSNGSSTYARFIFTSSKDRKICWSIFKARSSPVEVINGIELPSYKGDMINDMAFNKKSREPDPFRLLKAYDKSASTLNLLRAFASGGMADLTKIQEWNLEFINGTKEAERFEKIAEKISESLSFMKACGITPSNTLQLRETEFYTSHEGLLLNYEECLTRKDTITEEKGWFATSAHMLWIEIGQEI